MLSLPDCTVLLGEKKKNLHLSKILLWSPLDFPTFKIFLNCIVVKMVLSGFGISSFWMLKMIII